MSTRNTMSATLSMTTTGDVPDRLEVIEGRADVQEPYAVLAFCQGHYGRPMSVFVDHELLPQFLHELQSYVNDLEAQEAEDEARITAEEDRLAEPLPVEVTDRLAEQDAR